MDKISIVLVDQEKSFRDTIHSLLEDHTFYEIVADLSNGTKALEWVRVQKADLLLCDMHMPDMDGVELIKNIRIFNKYLPIIVISDCDSFEEVRGGLVHGAADYFLKQGLSKEMLLRALDRTRASYGDPSDQQHVILSRFTSEHITSLIHQGQLDFGMTNLIPLAISIDYRYPAEILPETYRYDICNAFLEILEQVLGKSNKYLVYRTKKEHLLILLSFEKEHSTLYMFNALSQLMHQIIHQARRLLNVTMTATCGEVHKDLECAISKVRFLDESLEDKLYLGGNRFVPASVHETFLYGSRIVPAELVRKLDYELECHMECGLETIQEVLGTMEDERHRLNQVRDACSHILESMALYDFLDKKEYEEAISRIAAFELFEDFRKEVLELYGRGAARYQKNQVRYSYLVQQVIDHVKHNYRKDISLEECAKLTGSCYSYLSSVFKKETGSSFVEFLSQQRVNNAKSLLIRKNLPMKEIANQSGFRNYNYFFKVFKKLTGVTPSEFGVM